MAKKAYREWLPVSDEPYAAYDVGDLATLFRIDSRLEGREEQFSLTDILKGKDNPQAMVEALSTFRDGDYADPARQMLGAAQEQWLAAGFAASTARGATWQVLIQQVLMGKVAAPSNLVDLLGDNVPPWAKQRLMAAALATKVGIPQNMDAWDGYPAARERVYNSALEADANLVVLAGDTHNAWSFDLEQDGAKVGVEFGVSSVTSPGYETYLSAVAPSTIAGALVDENDELKWADTSQRGYMTVELTPSTATTEWRFVSGIKTRSTALAGKKRISVEAGAKVQGA